MASEIWLPIHYNTTGTYTKFRACRACSAPLHFTRGEKGTWVPLDLSTSRVNEKSKKWEAQSHYQTCTNPERFSTKGKRARATPPQET